MKSWIGLVAALFCINNLTFARRIKRHGNEPHDCDDGKHGIEIDLHGERDWKCMDSEWEVDGDYRADKRCYDQESAYHVCIDKTIDNLYESDIPHSGPHRKVWAQYGEYSYLPPGRYVHNLEHGGVVFMYHPCASQKLVEMLRRTATTCLYRYIVTAFPKLTKEYPFAVITYGCIYRMSQVNPPEIKEWIRQQFGQSPEPDVYGNGLYNHSLLVPSIDPGSYDYSDDSQPFCPNVPLFGTKNEEMTMQAEVSDDDGHPDEIGGRETGLYHPKDHHAFTNKYGHGSTSKEQDSHDDNLARLVSNGYSDSKQEAANTVISQDGKSEVTVHWDVEGHPVAAEESIIENGAEHVDEKGTYPENTFTSGVEKSNLVGYPEISISLNDPAWDKGPDNTADAKVEPMPHDDAPSQPSSKSSLVTESPDLKGKSQKWSLLFWLFVSFACFVMGLLVGLCIMNMRRTRDGMSMKKCRVWSDRDSADSFSIAAVVRKIPDTFVNRKSNDDYHRLEPNEQSSDEDNPI